MGEARGALGEERESDETYHFAARKCALLLVHVLAPRLNSTSIVRAEVRSTSSPRHACFESAKI